MFLRTARADAGRSARRARAAAAAEQPRRAVERHGPGDQRQAAPRLRAIRRSPRSSPAAGSGRRGSRAARTGPSSRPRPSGRPARRRSRRARREEGERDQRHHQEERRVKGVEDAKQLGHRPRKLAQFRAIPLEAKRMSLESVRAWLAAHAPDLELIEVARAPRPSPPPPPRSASRRAGSPRRWRCAPAARPSCSSPAATPGSTIRSARPSSGARPRMLGAEETLALTGHPVGGVCPFGLARPVPVYLDVSLRGVRSGLSGRRFAQHLGRGRAASACSSWSERAGSICARS